MNFKPTKWKVIGTVVIWFLTNFIFWLFYPVPGVGGIFYPVPCVGGNKECIPASPTMSSAFYFTFSHPFSWMFLVIVYVVWSLIQKKK